MRAMAVLGGAAARSAARAGSRGLAMMPSKIRPSVLHREEQRRAAAAALARERQGKQATVAKAAMYNAAPWRPNGASGHGLAQEVAAIRMHYFSPRRPAAAAGRGAARAAEQGVSIGEGCRLAVEAARALAGGGGRAAAQAIVVFEAKCSLSGEKYACTSPFLLSSRSDAGA